MAQKAIREFDVKNMFFDYIKHNYNGYFISSLDDFKDIKENKKYVIKPDELFGKRGKLGLLGINLEKNELITWYKEKISKEIEINSLKGFLKNFIVEEFIPHDEEFYVSITSKREGDELTFSNFGGIDIEENWEKTKSILISPLEKLNKELILKNFGVKDEKILQVIIDLFNFYRDFDFAYLEVNPFCFNKETKELVILDMVAKLDNTAFFKHNSWNNISFPNSFGSIDLENEKYIMDLDEKTGASLKLKFLNLEGSIWLLLSGGGGSLVITDTLGYLGYSKEIANYGELSGDPTREYTFEYTKVLIEQMLKSKNAKYLIIAGAIANFTQIDKTFLGIIDVLDIYYKEIIEKDIKILVRRGGLNDKIGLKLLKDTCDKYGIKYTLTGSETYMTDILKEIKL
ncbi:ATPase [Candidatus Gracilibacteria bacterium]|nr:ATPase [Candidatus Gracilibacteria bacterium]